MSKASFAYQKLYGDSLKETAAGDYIKELESEKAELLQIVKRCYEYEYTYDTTDFVRVDEFQFVLQKHGVKI